MALAFALRAPVLELADPLAEFLGALEPGATFRYTYEDAVKLAGHSCPTVAGAYLATAAALRALYPDSVPRRGEIAVVMGGSAGDGHTGPAAQVIALLTGAAPETGFGGLMGNWRRRNLLTFDPALGGRIRFRRADTGREVEVTLAPEAVPPSPRMAPLLAASLAGRATPEERRQFAELWQGRVAEMLSGDPSRIARVREVS